MSRSKGSRKTTKAARNIEYWSRRPGSNTCRGAVPGRAAKKLTHRLERNAGKRETREEP